MTSLETYRFDFLNNISYLNVTGQIPEVFDWIGGQTFNGVNLTGVHSIKDHGLKAGDYITLVSNNPRYTGKFQVKAIGADDGTYMASIFDIAVIKQVGETASGTWQLSSAIAQTDQGCATGSHKDTIGNCVIDVNINPVKGITIGGKTYTINQIGTFILSLVLLSFALAFPLKTPTKIEQKVTT